MYFRQLGRHFDLCVRRCGIGHANIFPNRGFEEISFLKNDPDLLLQRFACFPSNAARTDIRLLARKTPINYVGVDGLSNLYLNWTVRWASQLDDAQPTDSQSEIVIFDTIPVQNIRKIHFSPYTPTETIESAKNLAGKYERLNLEFNCSDGFFDSEPSSEYAQRNYQLDWK